MKYQILFLGNYDKTKSNQLGGAGVGGGVT